MYDSSFNSVAFLVIQGVIYHQYMKFKFALHIRVIAHFEGIVKLNKYYTAIGGRAGRGSSRARAS